MIRIDVDASVMSKRFGNLGSRFQPYIKATFEKLVKEAFGEVQKLTGKTAPGRTNVQKLWRMDKKSSGTKDTYKIHNIYADWKVLWWREVGTPRHTIRARNKPMLHFYWEKRARWVKTFQVSHPGQSPRLMVHLTATHFRDRMRTYERDTYREAQRLWNMGIR